MTVRQQRHLEQVPPRSFFRVRTKARTGEAYPASSAAAGWFLPIVYNAQRWASGTFTEVQSQRTELAYSRTWLAEGTDCMAFRFGERLFLLPVASILLQINGIDNGFGVGWNEITSLGSQIWGAYAPYFTPLLTMSVGEVAYGPDGSRYMASSAGTAFYPGRCVFKAKADGSTVDWAAYIGETASSSGDGAYSLAVFNDGRVVAAVFDQVATVENNAAVSFDASGTLQWAVTKQHFPASVWQPFCVSKLSDGSAWFIAPGRLVRIKADGSVLVNLTTPPLRSSTGAYVFGSADTDSGDILGVLLHENLSGGAYQSHSVLFLYPDGSARGIQQIYASGAGPSNTATAHGVNAHCVTAANGVWYTAWPVLSELTPDAVSWARTGAGEDSRFLSVVNAGSYLLVSDINTPAGTDIAGLATRNPADGSVLSVSGFSSVPSNTSLALKQAT